MPNPLSTALLALAVSLYPFNILAAQSKKISYDFVGELSGAALIDLSIQLDLVKRVLRSCGANRKSVRSKAPAMIQAWQKRNAPLQELLPIYQNRNHCVASGERCQNWQITP